MTNLNWTTYAQRPDLRAQAQRLNASVWPEFMLHDPVADELFDYIDDDFGEYQSMLYTDEGRVVVVGNAVPLVWDGTRADMPTGWDDGLTRAVADLKAGRTPNALMAIQATVATDMQGRGLSKLALKAMKYVGAQHALTTLIAPVRPNQKHLYPLTSMERYITWTRADGSDFDAWLRVHQSLGAELVGVCAASMRIPATLAEWEARTEMRFPDSGEYIVPGALNPVTIDRERDCGEYVEPNVWMRHTLTEADLRFEQELSQRETC
ncbi:MAG: GNAT family N-acetyltransferase [Anaerolineales bacterium]